MITKLSVNLRGGERMISDDQVRRLKKMLSRGKNLKVSALTSGMDAKTARKYRDLEKLPSELKNYNCR